MTTLAQLLEDGLPAGMIADASAWTAKADDFPRPVGGGSTSGVRFIAGGVSVSLPEIDERWGDPADAATAVCTLAEQVRGREPGILTRSFPALAVELVRGGPRPRFPAERGWLVAVRLAEAVRIVLEDAATAGDVTAARVLPLVHRTRFLLLWAPRRFPAVSFPVSQALGSPDALVPRAEQARLDWALDLVNHEEHLRSLSWQPGFLERELRRLVFVDHVGTGRREPLPAPLPTNMMPQAAGADPDPGFRAWLAREAFLPRFMLGHTWRVLRPAVGRGPFAVLALMAMLLLTPAVVSASAFDGHVVGVLRGAAGLTGATYLVMFLLTMRCPEMTSLWCLRLPAGAALGMVALISLDDGWARTSGRAAPLIAAAALLAAAAGYLAFEAQAHGVPYGRVLAGRVLAVVGLGFAHAVGVASLVLALIVPAVGPGLAGTLAGHCATPPAELLTLAASVGLAAGVLLQMLWDDRPVTYPLTHLPWRGRTR
ncbi:hypothetical protein [Frankia sp. CiP3]|uniref:hypothetical protein n=1 Tax=Frankia sp. CiP3 TaxID=2880971 RepID=UPI001EF653AA|nr:hypothetical protein [Frankia sp. CiP3]